MVCKERKWTQIALKMGFAPGKAVGSHLRAHYERILYPYYLFQTGANLMVRSLKHLYNFPFQPYIIQFPSLFLINVLYGTAIFFLWQRTQLYLNGNGAPIYEALLISSLVYFHHIYVQCRLGAQ